MKYIKKKMFVQTPTIFIIIILFLEYQIVSYIFICVQRINIYNDNDWLMLIIYIIYVYQSKMLIVKKYYSLL